MTRDEKLPHDAEAPEHDYLWDRSGPPDAEIVALERALGAARWKGARPASSLPRALPAARPAARPRWLDARRRRLVACAAAVLVVAAGVTLSGRWSAAPADGDSLAHGPAAAAPRYRAEALSGALALTELRVGDRLETDAATRARVTIGDLGSVLVEPGSELRVDATGPAPGDALAAGGADGEVPHRLYLERGALTASIFAAPRLFAVGTPSGLAVDLGCVYTARVADDGSTLLSVVFGQVSFESDGRQVTVPSGASAHATPGSGPGTPVWDDAPSAYRKAVARLDALVAGTAPTETLAPALGDVLRDARPEDTLTLWHLLAWRAVPAPGRELVLDALIALAPLPADVRREDCLAADAGALRRWREGFAWAW